MVGVETIVRREGINFRPAIELFDEGLIQPMRQQTHEAADERDVISAADRVANETAARPQHPRRFAKERCRINHVFQDHHRHDGIEMSIREGNQRRRWARAIGTTRSALNPGGAGNPHPDLAFVGAIGFEISVHSTSEIEDMAASGNRFANSLVKALDVMQVVRKEPVQEGVAHGALRGGGAAGRDSWLAGKVDLLVADLVDLDRRAFDGSTRWPAIDRLSASNQVVRIVPLRQAQMRAPLPLLDDDPDVVGTAV